MLASQTREILHEQILTTDDNILSTIEDLNGAIWVPYCQISRVQYAPSKQFSGGLRILVVTAGTNITHKYNLTDLLAVSLDINDCSLGHISFDHTGGKTRDETMALASHFLIFFFQGNLIPLRQEIAFGDRPVRLGHTINVNWVKIEIRHLLEQMRRWRAGSHRDAHRMRQLFSFLSITEERIDSRCGIEMSDTLLLQQSPDLGVVDLAETVMSSANSGHSPWECPTYQSS